mmetsp:Transcript_4472/g.6864  ORF Transcript_4472/g.6864 Transcript_4472/m.6864 type:complete len:253 (+) Transcript_4472:2292-3050(+)
MLLSQARLQRARAADSLKQSVPLSNWSTSGSTAPAKAIAVILAALSRAKLRNAQVEASLQLSPPPRSRSTRAGIAPASATWTWLSLLQASAPIAAAAAKQHSLTSERTICTRGSRTPAAIISSSLLSSQTSSCIQRAASIRKASSLPLNIANKSKPASTISLYVNPSVAISQALAPSSRRCAASTDSAMPPDIRSSASVNPAYLSSPKEKPASRRQSIVNPAPISCAAEKPPKRSSFAVNPSCLRASIVTPL